VTGEFFVLAFSAAVNPSLLAVDLVLIANRRPSAMLLTVLLGGLATAVAIGLIDVLVIHSDVTKTQQSLGPSADLVIGVPSLTAGILLLTGFPRRRAGAQATARREKKHPGEMPGWAQRALAQPRLGAALLVGAVLGLPGALYLAALHNLNTGHSSTATKVVSVILFCLIEFTLLIVPAVLLVVRPDSVRSFLARTQDWLTRHGRKALAYVALALGAYLTITGLVSLLS
jgi:Sap, sulfolipid-1-addressing protein